MEQLPKVKAEIVKQTIADMQTMGTYRKEYDRLVEMYAQMCEQYATLSERFERSGYKVQTKSAQGGMKKSPIVATMETLRKDIMALSDRLCLNPKSYESMDVTQPKENALAEALRGLG